MTRYIKSKQIKILAKENGRRTSKEFLAALDAFIENKVRQAIALHNGKKTLDENSAAMAGIVSA